MKKKKGKHLITCNNFAQQIVAGRAQLLRTKAEKH